MKNFCYLIIIFLIFPSLAFAQQDDSDPFKRDPIFTKPLDDFFGSSDEESEAEPDTEQQGAKVVRHLTTEGIDLGGGLEGGPYYSNSLYSQYPNLSTVHYNRVNGLFLGLKKERMQWHHRGSFLNIPQIQPHGFIGYGTASKEWEYAIGLEKLIGENKRMMIGGEFHRATATEDYRRTGLIENSLTSFFGAYDFLDYHKMEGFGFYTAYRTQRWWEAAFSYNRDTFTSAEQNTGFSMFGRSGAYRPNPAIDINSDEIDIDSYSLSLSYNPRNVLLTDKFTFSAMAEAELGDNSATDEEYRYDKYQAIVKLFYNFEPGSVLRWKLHTGGITGNAPDFKSFYLGGIGTLRGSPYKFFQGNQLVASNLEIQFGRPSSISGRWLRNHGLHLLLFLDSGWTRSIPELTDTSNPFRGLKEFSFSEMQHDAGIGIGSRALRAELAWPLKEFGNSPAFWIRFNPTF